MEVPASEYSPMFDKHRKEKVAVSYYKYGPASRNFPNNVNALASMERAVQKYLDTHNKEYLCDAANYLMFEYMYPAFQDARYVATDSKDSAGLVGMAVQEMEDFKNGIY